jgi:mRNA interferase MazF
MKRGEIVIVSLPGDYGKPRPAVVLQSDRLEHVLESVIVALLTTSQEGGRVIRVAVDPTTDNSLQHPSRVMVDKLYTVPLHRISQRTGGQIDVETLRRVDRALMIMLGLDPLRPLTIET